MKRGFGFLGSRLLAAVAALFAISTTAIAAPIYEENFIYNAPSGLNGQGGWSAHSGAGVNPQTVNAGSLSYAGYPSSGIGNLLGPLATSGEDNNHTFTGQTSGAVYLSALINVVSTQTTGDYFLHFFDGPIAGNIFRARLFAKKDAASTNYALGIQFGSTVATVYTPFSYTPGTTHLVVIKYTFNAGLANDVASLIIDPAISPVEPAPNVSHSDATQVDAVNLDGIAIRQGSGAQAASVQVDGIRVSLNWTDAVGAVVNHTITASAAPGGSISPSGAVTVPDGGSQTFTISPSDKCHFIQDVQVDGVSVGPVSSYTFSNVTADHTIHADFGTFGPFTITASAGTGGTISPNGPTQVACGGGQKFNIAADPCYTIQDVLVDGNSVGATTSYTFTDVQANHTISATFAPSPAVTTTTLTQDSGKTFCGDKVTFTATVSPAGATGDVEFFDNGNSIGIVTLDANSTASLSVSNLTQGPHSITAHYHSDPCNQKSDSNKLMHNVNLVPTSATLSGPAKLNCGEKLSLTATVSPVFAGSFTFQDNGDSIGAASVDHDGTATLSIPGGLSAGQHSLVAVFMPNDPCAQSAFSNKVVHEVNGNATTTTLTSDPNPSHTTEKVTLTATVAPGTASGEVNFFDSGLPIGSGTLNNGVAELSVPTFAVGTHSLTATYKGDSCNTGSTSNKVEQVVDDPTDVLLSLFRTEPVLGGGIELRWQLTESQSVASIGLERSRVQSGPWDAVSAERRADGDVTVALDRTTEPGQTYFYRLVVTTTDGRVQTFGPVAATAGAGITEFTLANIAPNPSKDHMMVDFTVARASRVRLSVVDIQGREVALLAGGEFGAGRYQATWNGRTASGPAPAGLYFIRFEIPGKNIMRKAVLSR